MRRCLKCEYVWLNEYGEPVSCSFGLRDGAAGLGSHCPKNKRKLRKMKETPNDSVRLNSINK